MPSAHGSPIDETIEELRNQVLNLQMAGDPASTALARDLTALVEKHTAPGGPAVHGEVLDADGLVADDLAVDDRNHMHGIGYDGGDDLDDELPADALGVRRPGVRHLPHGGLDIDAAALEELIAADGPRREAWNAAVDLELEALLRPQGGAPAANQVANQAAQQWLPDNPGQMERAVERNLPVQGLAGNALDRPANRLVVAYRKKDQLAGPLTPRELQLVIADAAPALEAFGLGTLEVVETVQDAIDPNITVVFYRVAQPGRVRLEDIPFLGAGGGFTAGVGEMHAITTLACV